MLPVPKIKGLTVGAAAKLDVFVSGALRLAVMPPTSPATSKIGNQDPPPGTLLDLGGTVTAIVASNMGGR